MDIECDAGCGVVPFLYRDKSFVNALQWAIGLEIFLTTDDPWRICLTTDHPNGAPFTSYPHLIRLLMDKTFRNNQLSRLHKGAVKASRLATIEREYSLYEIAIISRAGPARLLGLKSKGHLGEGADADVVVYTPHDNQEKMFSQAALLFKSGELVVEDGAIIALPHKQTFVARPQFDNAITHKLKDWYQQYHTINFANAALGDAEMADHIGSNPKAIALNERYLR
jgi:formylmethanofuran dehydrogenase subunit A